MASKQPPFQHELERREKLHYARDPLRREYFSRLITCAEGVYAVLAATADLTLTNLSDVERAEDFIKEARLVLKHWPAEKPHAAMLRVNGKPFRCECGTNVFSTSDEHIYTCNGCGNVYEGTPVTSARLRWDELTPEE